MKSGGSHFYMEKSADLAIVDTLKDYPGVEFKSKGLLVVDLLALIHPETLKGVCVTPGLAVRSPVFAP